MRWQRHCLPAGVAMQREINCLRDDKRCKSLKCSSRCVYVFKLLSSSLRVRAATHTYQRSSSFVLLILLTLLGCGDIAACMQQRAVKKGFREKHFFFFFMLLTFHAHVQCVCCCDCWTYLLASLPPIECERYNAKMLLEITIRLVSFWNIYIYKANLNIAVCLFWMQNNFLKKIQGNKTNSQM